MNAPRIVACPSCRDPVPWTEASRWRPFCSERCRVIDLGDWAADRHVIPGDARPEDAVDGSTSTSDPTGR